MLRFSLYILVMPFAVYRFDSLRTWHAYRGDCAGPVRNPPNTSGLQVVNAGLYKTGTTSVAEALMVLGMRTYRCPDHANYLFNVFNRRAAEALLWQEPQVTRGWVDMFGSALARCRVDALTLEPLNHLLPEILAASPGVKVVLTVRDFDSWFKSLTDFGVRLEDFSWLSHTKFSALTIFPWLRVVNLLSAGAFYRHMAEGGPELVRWDTTKGGLLNYLAVTSFDYQNLLGAARAQSAAALGWPGNPWRMAFHAAFESTPKRIYREWHTWVREIVPPDQLLELDVRQHGWNELCDFLGLPVPGVPWIHAQKKTSTPAAPLVNNPMFAKVCDVLALVAHLMNFLLFEAFISSCKQCRLRNKKVKIS